MRHLLDTDELSLLERGGTDSFILQRRLETVSASDLATTIVTYEEQMRGWLSRIAVANTPEKILASYNRLQIHVETFRGIPVVPFDTSALKIFERLQKSHRRLGTMDLKIAAIAIANDALLLSRNLAHFSQIPDLRVEDWSR